MRVYENSCVPVRVTPPPTPPPPLRCRRRAEAGCSMAQSCAAPCLLIGLFCLLIKWSRLPLNGSMARPTDRKCSLWHRLPPFARAIKSNKCQFGRDLEAPELAFAALNRSLVSMNRSLFPLNGRACVPIRVSECVGPRTGISEKKVFFLYTDRKCSLCGKGLGEREGVSEEPFSFSIKQFNESIKECNESIKQLLAVRWKRSRGFRPRP